MALSLSLPFPFPRQRFLYVAVFAVLAALALLAAPAGATADLGISKLDAPDPVRTGTSFNYLLRITNYGPDSATTVTVTDTLPATVAYVSSSGAGWACGHSGSPTGGVVTCTRASLAMTAEDAQSVITITVTAPGSPQALTNNASIGAAAPADPYSPNNTVAHGTTIQAPPNGGGTCWAVDDNGGSSNPDGLATIFKDGSGLVDRGPIVEPANGNAAIDGIESITFGPFAGGPNLYAADDGRLGTLSLTATNPAVYTNIGSFGSGTGQGDTDATPETITYSDIDGLAFHPQTLEGWAIHRRGDNDVIFAFDGTIPSGNPANLAISGRFPDSNDSDNLPDDYIMINPSICPFPEDDMDDLAISNDGRWFVQIDNNGANQQLAELQIVNGIPTGNLISCRPLMDACGGVVEDMEGTGIDQAGEMWGTTGNGSNNAAAACGGNRNDDRLWLIDPYNTFDPPGPVTAAHLATRRGDLRPAGTDWEGTDCRDLSASGINTITGTVYFDGDQNALLHATETGQEGVTVNLYSDQNNNGVVDGGDLLVQTKTTNSNGGYSFIVLGSGNYVLAINSGTLPPGSMMTTNNVEEADFTGNGFTDAHNDFGFIRALAFDWGDLPNGVGPGLYATLAASNGPSHEISAANNVYLGGAPDSEVDGQPNGTATGDDGDLNGDDEDGVTFLTPLHPGRVADISVQASNNGVLNAWIDFNSDGDFADPGEQIAMNLALTAGANLLNNVPVPAGATGTMAARFRITNLGAQGGGSPTGPATTGEVEDHALGCIGDLVWNDLDGDGEQDGGLEAGVAGVTVNLVSPAAPFFLPVLDGAGAPITATTDANGSYRFCGLPTVENSGLANPGQYRILFDLPGGFTDFSPPNTVGDAIDSDADQDQFGTGVEGLAPLPALAPITISSGVNDPTVDAGLRAITAALITSAAAYNDGGSVVFEFSTGYEALTASYEVYRFDRDSMDYVPVSEGPVSALLGSPQGGIYRVADEHAPFSERLSYVIVEHQTDGRARAYGPFSVGLEPRGDRAALRASSSARPRVSKQMASRMVEARQEAARSMRKASAGKRSAGSRGASRLGSGFADPGVSVSTAQVNALESGLYYVPSVDLAAALGLAESTVRTAVMQGNVVVENEGRAIAWLEADGSGDGLYFYGEAIDSLYTLENTYWLKVRTPGVPMEVVASASPRPAAGGIFTSTERFEEDLLPSINATLETEADFWFWDGINAASSNRIRTFDVTVPDAAAGSATLTARFAGATNGLPANDHHAIVRVNGVEIGTAAWGGIGAFAIEMAFDSSLLTPTTTLEVEGTLAGGAVQSIFFIDGFDIEYPRSYRAVADRLSLSGDGNAVVTVEGFSSADVVVFDLSDPALPQRVGNVLVEAGGNGFQASFVPRAASTPYLATTLTAARAGSNLRPYAPAIELIAAHHSFEHVVIAPQAWMSEAEDLAAYRSSQGMASLAVSIEEVYNAFSWGNPTPWAIRDFLAYARDNWVQGPDYAVLAGRGTFDPRNLQGAGDSFIPVVLVGTPHGLVSTDNVLADLVGGDSIPDVALGRLPIVSGGELAAYVGKLEAYDASSGDWRGRAVLLADNADAAGNFPLQSDAVGALLPGYARETIYLSDMDVNTARAALVTAWNNGAQLVNYIGHGGVTQAAAEGLLRVGDMGLLTNGDRLPIVSALTCMVGRSDVPSLESLAEALVTRVDGGAVAVWAPTGVSLSGAAHELNLLYAGILSAAADDTALGDIVLDTLNAYGVSGGAIEMLNAYAIAGDPAVRLP